MSTFAPEGWHSITPRLFVDDPARMVTFLRDAFGGTGELHGDRPAEIWIGDSVVMVGSTEVRGPTSSFMYVYVEDADATYAAALAAGAESAEEPLDTPYGDRRAMVNDPFGNSWQIATRRV